MTRELINKDMKANEIDKIVARGVKDNFEVMKSDCSVLPDGSVKVTTDNSRTFVMLQRLFGFKPV